MAFGDRLKKLKSRALEARIGITKRLEKSGMNPVEVSNIIRQAADVLPDYNDKESKKSANRTGIDSIVNVGIALILALLAKKGVSLDSETETWLVGALTALLTGVISRIRKRLANKKKYKN